MSGVAQCTLALGPDTAGALLRELVERATAQLDVAVYEVGPAYAPLLARAAERGVAVRLLLDAHAGANATTAAIVAGSGVHCRVIGGHPGAEAHWKLIVADATVATGTGNLLRRDAPPPGQAGTREWWASASGAPHLHASARAAFDSAWREASPPPVAWRHAVAPPPAIPPVGVPPDLVPSLHLDVPAACLGLAVGGASVHALLASRVASARARALAIVPYVHTHVGEVRAVLDAMAAAAARGADARVLLGTSPEPRDAAALAAAGIAVRVMDPLRCTTGHAKGLVADGAALVCSANWSGAGLGGNRESALILDDARAADWFAAALERDWELSTPLGAPGGPPKG